MRRRVLALLTLPVTACGVDAQDGPESVIIRAPSSAQATATGASDDPRFRVWFVRGTQVEPVERPAPLIDIDAALEALVAGPSRAEVIGGLRTALSPRSLDLREPMSTGAVVTVHVSRSFTDVSGGNQLLAVAQVVFTVSEIPGVDAVRLAADGEPVEVPTDDGLTAEPVDRADYASVAVLPAGPAAVEEQPTDSRPATPPPPGTTTTPAPTRPPPVRRAGGLSRMGRQSARETRETGASSGGTGPWDS